MHEVGPLAVKSADTPHELLSVEEAAAYLRSPPGTLAHWRATGGGPRFAKLGRRIVYRREWLDEWVDAQSASSCIELKKRTRA